MAEFRRCGFFKFHPDGSGPGVECLRVEHGDDEHIFPTLPPKPLDAKTLALADQIYKELRKKQRGQIK